jgi:DNA-binding CsgD family transcriptional regulator
VGRLTEEVDPSRAADPSNGLAERMLKGFAEPVFVIDGPSRTVMSCNDAALAAFGFTLDEFVGRRLFDHASSEEERRRYDSLMARADEVYATSGVFQERILFSNKSGVALPCDIVGLPFFRPDASLALIIAMLFDRSREEEGRCEIAGLVGRVNELAAELSSRLSRYTETIATTCLSDLGFTRRQVEIARLVALGASSKDIGFRLGIAESTVKNHLSVMYRKLGAASKICFMHALAERRIRIA